MQRLAGWRGLRRGCAHALLGCGLAAALWGVTALPALADRSVRVRAGDTLSSISLAYYGDVSHVRAIAAFNHLANPNQIRAGQLLTLPGLAASEPREQTGVATWYGPGFHGKVTKCGQVYDQWGISAASNDHGCGAVIEVTNLRNGRSVVAEVTDTGGFRHPDIVDLSRGAFSRLAPPDTGVIPVRVRLRAPGRTRD